MHTFCLFSLWMLGFQAPAGLYSLCQPITANHLCFWITNNKLGTGGRADTLLSLFIICFVRHISTTHHIYVSPTGITQGRFFQAHWFLVLYDKKIVQVHIYGNLAPATAFPCTKMMFWVFLLLLSFLIQWTKHSQIWHEDYSAF